MNTHIHKLTLGDKWRIKKEHGWITAAADNDDDEKRKVGSWQRRSRLPVEEHYDNVVTEAKKTTHWEDKDTHLSISLSGGKTCICRVEEKEKKKKSVVGTVVIMNSNGHLRCNAAPDLCYRWGKRWRNERKLRAQALAHTHPHRLSSESRLEMMAKKKKKTATAAASSCADTRPSSRVHTFERVRRRRRLRRCPPPLSPLIFTMDRQTGSPSWPPLVSLEDKKSETSAWLWVSANWLAVCLRIIICISIILSLSHSFSLLLIDIIIMVI